MSRGFSLVELSIVLVILGLLTGGILAGQSLIRAAELRSVSTDFSRFHTAMYTFRDKYFQLPGDMSNAFAFWGTAAGCTNVNVNSNVAGCNGDGNGLIQIGSEAHRAWQHLALAGLIEGTYTGLNGGGTGCSSTCDSVAGSNIPRARLSNGGYSISRTGQDPAGDTATMFSTLLGSSYNVIMLGNKQPNFYYNVAILKPEEAWNIDTKMDDGRPQYGNIFPYRHNTCTTTNDPATANYNLIDSGTLCILMQKF